VSNDSVLAAESKSQFVYGEVLAFSAAAAGASASWSTETSQAVSMNALAA